MTAQDTTTKPSVDAGPIMQDYFFPEHSKPSITIRASSLEEAQAKLEEIKNKK